MDANDILEVIGLRNDNKIVAVKADGWLTYPSMVSKMSDSDTWNVPVIEERMFWMPMIGAFMDLCPRERRILSIKQWALPGTRFRS
jgi:hypothetical protein